MVPALACAEDLAPVALNSLSTVPALSSTQVLDQQKHILGQAERILADQDGKPSALSFRAQNGKTVIVSAAAVSYDGHVLIADNDQPQIAALIQLQRTAAVQ